MNNRKLNFLAIVLGVFVAATIYVGFVHGGLTEQHPQKEHITTLPKITSCIQALPVQSNFFRKRHPDSDSMELVLQLMNTSDTPIVAVSIEWVSKQNHTKGSLVTSSFGADTSKILAMPHTLYEAAIPVENFPPDSTVQIGSVMFADGTEAGCTNSLKELRELKSKREKKPHKDSKDSQK